MTIFIIVTAFFILKFIIFYCEEGEIEVRKTRVEKVMAIFIAILVVFSAIPMQVSAVEKQGIPINTVAELKAWDGKSNVYLVKDLDLSGEEWVPLAIDTGVVFDGKGHKITGLTQTTGLDQMQAMQYGLFWEISGIVKNLGVEGNIIVSETQGNVKAGLLSSTCGNRYSNVLNCYAVGTITTPNYTDVSSRLRVGGLFGTFSGGTMANCYSASVGLPLAASLGMTGISILDCYYDGTLFTGEHPDSLFGGSVTKKTTEEMKSQEFVDLLNEKKDFTGTEEGQASNDGNPWGLIAEGYPLQCEFVEKQTVEITDEAGLRAIADDLGGNYVLKNNIDVVETWIPLGSESKPFKGKFDGNGHTIRGISVDGSQKDAGLFGYSKGSIRNVGVEGTIASEEYYARVGGIAGSNNGLIENCYSKVRLISKNTENMIWGAGGIVSSNNSDGSINNCYAVTTIEGKVSNTNGAVANNDGKLRSIYYDQTVYNCKDFWPPKEVLPRTTEYMQSGLFAMLLNAEKGSGYQWTIKTGEYPSFGTDVLEVPPVLTGTVAIKGTPKVGSLLEAVVSDALTTDGLQYQWLLSKDGKTRVVGGNAAVYKPALSEVGGTIAVKVTSSVQAGTLESFAEEVVAEDPNNTSVARIETLNEIRNNVSFSYLNSDDPWKILEMVAAGQKENLTNIEAVIADAIKIFQNPQLQATDDEKYIMALSALGIDATAVPLGDKRINGVASMAAKNMDGLNVLIFALPAYDAGNYNVPQNASLRRSQIVEKILDMQTEEGDWSLSGSGTDPDMTAMALHALAPIYHAPMGFYEGISAPLQERVRQGVDLGVARLSQLQLTAKKVGAFSDYRGTANSNSTAMVICALSALGINPDTDYRFIKNGKSALDGLMTFATKDHKGFGYTNTTMNDMATEQGFRAVLCYEGITKSKDVPYNIYKLGEVTPTPPPVKPDPDPGTNPGEPVKKISASVRIIGDSAHSDPTEHGTYVNWYKTTKFTLSEGSTVYDLFMKAMDSSDLEEKGAAKNYVKSIKAPKGYGGHWLGEFDNGKNSGWMYLVNGTYPDVGLKEKKLSDGDEVIWHYVDDYTIERDKGKWKEASDNNPPTKDTTVKSGETVESKKVEFQDVPKNHWAVAYIENMVSLGLMKGKETHIFAPNDAMTRAEFITVLARMGGDTLPAYKENFTDVPLSAWYAKNVAWAVENNIAGGNSKTTFTPNSSINREEVAVMLCRYAEYKKHKLADIHKSIPFADQDSISDWAKDSVSAAQKAGIISGKENNRFAPKESTSRCEVAKMLSIFLEAEKVKE